MSRSTSLTTWVPYVAAVAGAILVVKGTLIIATNNAIPDGPMGALYLAGFGLGLLATIGFGIRQRAWLPGLAVGTASALLFASWIMGLGDYVKPVIALVSDADHVKAEVPIVLAGLVLLVVAMWAHARDSQAASEVTVG